MGRPSTFDQDAADLFLDKFRSGGLVNAACGQARLARRTVYGWLQRGETGEEPFATFLADYLEARADNQVSLKQAAMTDPKSALWFLERCYPEEFGLSQRVEQAAAEQLQQWLDTIVGELSDSARDEVLAAVSRHVGGAALEPAEVDGRAEAEAVTVEGESVGEAKLLPAGADR